MEYTGSKIEKIDTKRYEEYLDMQGATQVIKRLTNTGWPNHLPSNPTGPYSSITGKYYGQPRTINWGDAITITPNNSNLYDCTSWDYFYNAPSYDYVGYFGSSYNGTSSTVTVLAESSSATQSLAFDLESADESENWEV